jgi:hypothetical protein
VADCEADAHRIRAAYTIGNSTLRDVTGAPVLMIDVMLAALALVFFAFL